MLTCAKLAKESGAFALLAMPAEINGSLSCCQITLGVKSGFKRVQWQPRAECRLVRVSSCQAGKIALCICFSCHASRKFSSLSLLPCERRKPCSFRSWAAVGYVRFVCVSPCQLAGEFGAFFPCNASTDFLGSGVVCQSGFGGWFLFVLCCRPVPRKGFESLTISHITNGSSSFRALPSTRRAFGTRLNQALGV